MAQTPFVPDEPMNGEAHEPDSPVLAREAESKPCIYKTKKYREGAKICLGGFVHVCRSGVWRQTAQECE